MRRKLLHTWVLIISSFHAHNMSLDTSRVELAVFWPRFGLTPIFKNPYGPLEKYIVSKIEPILAKYWARFLAYSPVPHNDRFIGMHHEYIYFTLYCHGLLFASSLDLNAAESGVQHKPNLKQPTQLPGPTGKDCSSCWPDHHVSSLTLFLELTLALPLLIFLCW